MFTDIAGNNYDKSATKFQVSDDRSFCLNCDTLVSKLLSSYGCSFCTSPSCSAADFLINGVEPVSKRRNKRSSLKEW